MTKTRRVSYPTAATAQLDVGMSIVYTLYNMKSDEVIARHIILNHNLNESNAFNNKSPYVLSCIPKKVTLVNPKAPRSTSPCVSVSRTATPNATHLPPYDGAPNFAGSSLPSHLSWRQIWVESESNDLLTC